MTVWAILPSYERPSQLQKVIQQLLDQELNQNLMLLVLDASKSNTSERMMQSFFLGSSNVLYERIDSKFLWSKSVNHGFSLISNNIDKADHILILNDDIDFPNHAIQNLLDLASIKDRVLTALEYLDDSFLVWTPEVKLKKLRVSSICKDSQGKFQTFNLDICNSRFTLYPGWFIKNGYRFSSFTSPHHYADLKFSLKARRNGILISGVPIRGYRSTIDPSVSSWDKRRISYMFNRKSPGYLPAVFSFWFQYITCQLTEFNFVKHFWTKVKRD